MLVNSTPQKRKYEMTTQVTEDENDSQKTSDLFFPEKYH
jgi:hypothetical protein